MAGQAEPGRLIGGRYRLLARLGAGGMGRVWRASDEALRIEVAVKEVWLPATPGPDADERLRRAEREARNAARLRDHPNVVAVHDVVVEDGAPWTVMQLVAGHTLEEHVEEYGPLSVAHAALVAGALLDALEAAHAAGIVHRDVKPANVMLADDGHVLLTDFGIAIGTTDTALTAAGSFLGSVEYIAPERARGTEGLAISDLFSLGVTLFQAAEGFSPFHRETATGTLTAVILDEAPPPVRAGRLTPLITGLLEKDPAARLGIAAARRLLTAPEVPPAATAVAPTVAPTVAPAIAPTVVARRPINGSGSGSTGQRRQANTGSRTPGTSSGSGAGSGSGSGSGATAPRAHGAMPPRRPTGPAKRPSQATDQRRRVQPPIAETRRPTPTGQRPHGPAAPARRRTRRPRGLILSLLVVATIGGIVAATLKHSSFTVTDVKVGDFVKVDATGHITAKISQKAAANLDGRKVTAREDRPDPEICKRLHAPGRADVEQQSAVSFCLVRPVEEATAPSQ
ncbi:serine/threonine protein kinase [Catenulispora sp. GAS73]|uniref:serine/threonine-protein kinase n=1 Tax=Catenulispora sp. GAS73 TaxID=3156269 RepID=UPI0035134413